VGTPYDEDDIEADKIYDQVDGVMDSRNKRKRELAMLNRQNKMKERPKISEQFADLKRDLNTVSAEEWDAIPEVGGNSDASVFLWTCAHALNVFQYSLLG
jgi:pre-mRNA-processing factor 6